MRKKARSRLSLFGLVVLLGLAGCVHVPVEPRPRPAPAPQPPPAPVAQPRPPPAVAPAGAPAVAVDVAFAIQVRLDRESFSPGGIDGRWGAKSEKALAAWQKKHKQTVAGKIDDAVVAALGDTNGVMAAYVVTAADHAALTPCPSSWLERSRLERMGHATIEEMLAEKFHVYRAALRRLNPDAAWPDPPAGTVVAVPLVQSKPLPPLSKIEIRLEQRTLRAYGTNGQLVAHFPCSIAADKAKRPAGETLRVVLWAENPDYTFDPELFAEDPEAAAIGKRLRIPPGPNNPVGLAWIGLDRPGYGIHGSPAPEEISQTESHGCFRLTNWDALKLVRAVRKDLPVVVLP
ncbi:MAG: L,D-transpeptidase family protein [Kiritimatiellia bacterium]